MKSLSKLFRIGQGPSSSHTIAPYNAALLFKRLLKPSGADHVVCYLYGSLARTGKGHGTDEAIRKGLSPYPVEVRFDFKTRPSHPNEMTLLAYRQEKLVFSKTYDSLGGGEIFSPDDQDVNEKDIYPFRSFDEIKAYIKANKIPSMKAFCLQYESPEIEAYLTHCVSVMFSSVTEGLKKRGRIPANHNPRLQLFRSAGDIYLKALRIEDPGARRDLLITAYAYSVSEGSASHDLLVTAPTCGSSGILPAVLYYGYHDLHFPLEQITDSLYLAGMIGNVVKQNASIAGAIGGCQAEVGTASSMAASALSELFSLSLYQAEYAAECAMEHFLGLSCDPVDGYVIIPCIERNGVGALRAYDSYLYARYIAPIKRNQVSFDNVVYAMKLTGDSLASAYKETAEGGLAEILRQKENGK